MPTLHRAVNHRNGALKVHGVRSSISRCSWRALTPLITLLLGIWIGNHLHAIFSFTLTISSQILPSSYFELYRKNIWGEDSGLDSQLYSKLSKCDTRNAKEGSSESKLLIAKAALDLQNRFGSVQYALNGIKNGGSSYIGNDTAEHSVVSTRRPRLLFMFATYTMDQFIYMQKTLDSMRDICNSGWDVTVHVQAASGFNYSHPRYEELADRLFCMSTQSRIPLLVDTYDKIGFGLNSKHRIYAREHLSEFDIFVYAEEDMIFTVSHLRAYLQSVRELQLAFPRTWLHYYIGFLRWEDMEDIQERVSWEYLPHHIHVVNVSDRLDPYVVTNNLNQAIYVLTRDHMIDLEDRCGFLTDVGQSAFYRELRWAMDQDWKYMAVGVSEWSSSFQLVLQCGLRRIIPSRNLQAFMMQHSTNKGQKRRLRKDLLNARDWLQLVGDKIAKAQNEPFKQLEEVYNTIIFQQYNLHLMRPEKYKGKSKWSWSLPSEH